MIYLVYLFYFLLGNLYIKIINSFLSTFYGKSCHYDCSKCNNWACLNSSKYYNRNYLIGIYDNYKNVCGKMGGVYFEVK